MLYDVNLLKLLYLGDLSFLLHLLCASYEHELYTCFDLCHAIFTGVQPMYFVSCVVSASSLLSMVLDVAVLLVCFCYILLLCKPAATSHYMHNLEMFTKDVLLHMSCSIHPCPWLHYEATLEQD